MFDRDELPKIILGASLRTLVNLLLVLMLVQGLTLSYHFSYKLFSDVPYRPATSESVTVTIPGGCNAKDVAAIMADNGLVDSEALMLARMYLGKYVSRVQAGTYILAPSMSPDEICRRICGISDEGAT